MSVWSTCRGPCDGEVTRVESESGEAHTPYSECLYTGLKRRRYVRGVRLRNTDTGSLFLARDPFDQSPTEEAILAQLVHNRNEVFRAVNDPQPVGFVRGTSLPPLRSNRLPTYICEIGVASSFRRRGVGKALVAAMLEYCRSPGYAEQYVLADSTNLAAANPYLSTGAITKARAAPLFGHRLMP
jgi:aminoglycoside 3-N-acetyltransferase I